MQLTSEDIHVIRKAHDKSLRQFGRVIGVSKSHLCRIEKEQQRVSDRINQKICEHFQIDELKLAKIKVFYLDILR